jgi:protein pelota
MPVTLLYLYWYTSLSVVTTPCWLSAASSAAVATDKLFRINNVSKRKKYADLVEGVREAGGEALVFSSMHVSGEALNNLSGVAAILRFPLPELEDQELIEEI